MKTTLLQAIILAVLSGATGFVWTQTQHPDLLQGQLSVPEVSAQALETLERPLIWIDARAEEDHAAGQIPDSISLRLTHWDSDLPGLLMRWQPEFLLLVYCGSENCQLSQQVARKLRDELEFENVRVLSGGYPAWQAAQEGE